MSSALNYSTSASEVQPSPQSSIAQFYAMLLLDGGVFSRDYRLLYEIYESGEYRD